MRKGTPAEATLVSGFDSGSKWKSSMGNGEKPVRILYIEDDAVLASLLQRILQRAGYAVDLAGDGHEGLALLARSRFDLLLLDYHLPGCNGLDVIHALGAMQGAPPAIMLTGAGNEKVAIEAMKLGAADYLIKDAGTNFLSLLPLIVEQTLEKKRLEWEKEQARAALEESEARYRKLVELSPDGISVHVDGRFVFINSAGAKMFGAASPSDLLGKSVFDLVHPDFREKIVKRLGLLQRGEQVSWLEQKLLRLDGTAIDAEVAALPFDYQGKPAVQAIFRDISERKRAEQRLYHLANFDPLTGLANRALFFERLERTLAQARRYGHRAALLYLDLDRFKEINDTFGHAAGDVVLREGAQRLTACLRHSDVLARLGGDEFAVILPEIADTAAAAVVAEHLLDALVRPVLVQGHSCRIGMSIGIGLYPEDGEEGAGILLKRADSAMYAAKRAGGNTYRFFQAAAPSP